MSVQDFHALTAREIFLNPGDLAYGFQKEVFGTLLGSCVAITLWHPVHRFGSICHFVLPLEAAKEDLDGRYGVSAFECQRHDLLCHGIDIHQCVAKIFGGSQMFSTSAVQDIGARNIATARMLIKNAGMMITAENVGGEGYRRLYFDVDTGEVWIKFDWLDNNQDDEIL